LAAVTVCAALALLASAQDYSMGGGNANRSGLPEDAGLGQAPRVYNDIGRGFLRWWYPGAGVRTELDNDESSGSGFTTPDPANAWSAPSTGNATVAFGYVQGNPPRPEIYRYANVVDDRAPGATVATYSWTFTGLDPNLDYEVYVNLPVGPTDVDNDPNVIDLKFPAKYSVFTVEQVAGGPDRQVIDVSAFGGGFVQLGDEGRPTLKTYRPAGNQIAVRLTTALPRAEDGSFLDPLLNVDRSLINRQIVYADAVRIVSRASGGTTGRYDASPVVYRLRNPDPGGGDSQGEYRVVASRNEPIVVGDLNRNYILGVTSSFSFNGALASAAQASRRNVLWSWPVRVPSDRSAAELNRYGRDKRDWILAPNRNRADQRIQTDNLNGGVSATAGFTVQPPDRDVIGPNYLSALSTGGAATEEVRYAPNLPEGRYFIEVWHPAVPDPALPVGTRIDVRQGPANDTFFVDQSRASGWYRLPDQPRDGYAHSAAVPLSVAITNGSSAAIDAGKPVFADAVRFVRQADLSVRSTPVMRSVRIQVSPGNFADRDVVVVAMENGRIYCMDAHGDRSSGNPPQVYWTYPTENPVGDPNRSVAFDGVDGIAEAPAGFDLGSALVQTINGAEYLYIGSVNGKVYCIEMSGRGDGTTVRRWTYPDDYDPTAPELPMARGLGKIAGSVAFATAAGNVPIVIVPTTEGRLIALDALGDAARRRTSPVWAYPDFASTPLGPILQTPTVSFGRAYFGAARAQGGSQGEAFAVNVADGSLAWRQDDSGNGGLATFGNASPVAVPAGQIQHSFPNQGAWDGEDCVFFCDARGKFVALNAETGDVIWRTNEVGTGAAGPLRFTFTRQFDGGNPNLLVEDVPMVVVPGVNGRMVGLHAAGDRTVGNVRSQVWGYRLDGANQVATLATGGWDSASGVRSWMYTGDSNGFLYAWNSTNDFQIEPVFPDAPPGEQELIENEDSELRDVIRDADIRLLSPIGFETLRERADDGSLTLADIDDAKANQTVLRRRFEYGETMYVLVSNLPRLSGQNANYYLEFEQSSTSRASQRRPVPVRYLGGGGNDGYCLLGLPLLTTGVSGVNPGRNFLTVSAVSPGNRGLRSQPRNLPPRVRITDEEEVDYLVGHPLALILRDNDGVVSSSIGDRVFLPNVGDGTFANFFENGSRGTDQNPGGPPPEPSGPFGPTLTSKGEPVSHGGSAVQRVELVDRSLMSLLMDRGLSQVRVAPRDIAWVKDPANPTTGGVVKPLLDNVGASYPGFEDYPVNVPNTSLDYPDVSRENMAFAANVLGAIQNPLFVNGISLAPPAITEAERNAYRTRAGYEAQMSRSLNPTPVDINLSVPRFQPPSARGYAGSQVVYIDSQVGQQQDLAAEVFRTFGLGLSVAIDTRVVAGTPTIDLGSLPSGGGYHGGPSFGPLNPWDAATRFSPWNSDFSSLFQPMPIRNEGNVNLLNVRLAKYYRDAAGPSPVELFMPGQHELGWIDGSLHLHSSLDPRFSSSRIVGAGAPGFDPQARNILQKPRPGDLIGTRFNVNPVSRPNGNLRHPGGSLFDPLAVPPGDAKIGVSAPIGAPSGQYIQRVYVFENGPPQNNVTPDHPTLNPLADPFTDPGVTLKFTVREARLTNAPTSKSAPMVERLLNGGEDFTWANTQPTAMRDGSGNLFVAWASNRLEATNDPGWAARARTENDLTLPDRWRIYVGSLRFDQGAIPPLTESPLADLNGWTASTAQRWFRQAGAVIDPPASAFAVDPGIGENLDPASVRLGSPTFPGSGFFNLLDPPANNGRPWSNIKWMAFIAEATKRDAAGNNSQLSQLMFARLTFGADGTVTVNEIVGSPHDPLTRKSKPSVVEGDGNVTAFFTGTTGQLGQLFYTTYQPDSADNPWRTGSFNLGPGFDTVGSPSAVLRRYQNANVARLELAFSATVKGRRGSEVYLGRAGWNVRDGRPSGRNSLIAFGELTDPLTVDPVTGVFWAPGVQWRTDQQSLDAIRVEILNAAQQRVDVWDGRAQTRRFDPASGILSFDSRLGGQVLVDTTNGSVRFTGGILSRDARLFVTYRPFFIRLSSGIGANHRSVSHVYDDRFIGVRRYQNQPGRDLVGDLSYWGNELNSRPADTDPIRWDRRIVVYSRTVADGGSAARPYYQTFRHGVELPLPVAIDRSTGSPLQFEVTWVGGGPPAERFYQLDPVTRKVYFMSGLEDRRVDIRYRPADETGEPYANSITVNATVRLVREVDEQAVPIEQPGNESALSVALDPLSQPYNNVTFGGRRPGLLWLFWTSSRTGNLDVFFQTIAPRFSSRPPNQ
jgi:outer membrane protein assembly factor BamB